MCRSISRQPEPMGRQIVRRLSLLFCTHLLATVGNAQLVGIQPLSYDNGRILISSTLPGMETWKSISHLERTDGTNKEEIGNAPFFLEFHGDDKVQVYGYDRFDRPVGPLEVFVDLREVFGQYYEAILPHSRERGTKFFGMPVKSIALRGSNSEALAFAVMRNSDVAARHAARFDVSGWARSYSWGIYADELKRLCADKLANSSHPVGSALKMFAELPEQFEDIVESTANNWGFVGAGGGYGRSVVTARVRYFEELLALAYLVDGTVSDVDSRLTMYLSSAWANVSLNGSIRILTDSMDNIIVIPHDASLALLSTTVLTMLDSTAQALTMDPSLDSNKPSPKAALQPLTAEILRHVRTWEADEKLKAYQEVVPRLMLELCEPISNSLLVFRGPAVAELWAPVSY